MNHSIDTEDEKTRAAQKNENDPQKAAESRRKPQNPPASQLVTCWRTQSQDAGGMKEKTRMNPRKAQNPPASPGCWWVRHSCLTSAGSYSNSDPCFPYHSGYVITVMR